MIGNTIKFLRLKKNISQKDLAKKSNLHQCQISKIESGSREIKVNELNMIAKALNEDVSILLKNT